MKKVTIGISLLIGGLYTALSIIQYAMVFLPNQNAWSTSYPSKLFFLIFAGTSRFNDDADGLGLGLFFVFGVALAILGIVVLGIEYFKKEKE